MASDALQDSGAVLQGGPHLAEAQVELGLDAADGLQAELVWMVHAQQGRYQLVQLLFGLLLLNDHALLQPAAQAQV